jgi:hypothetical protein
VTLSQLRSQPSFAEFVDWLLRSITVFNVYSLSDKFFISVNKSIFQFLKSADLHKVLHNIFMICIIFCETISCILIILRKKQERIDIFLKHIL